MIYIVVNIKGGSGKSYISNHILPYYIQNTTKQKSVSLYEFDEYSKTSDNYLKKSKYVHSSVIKEKDIKEEIFDVRFTSSTEDVIVDVGAGALLKQISELAELGLGQEKLVFVVPYSDDSSIVLLDTIAMIKKHNKDPKIVIVINRVAVSDDEEENVAEIAVDLFGSSKYNLPPSDVLKSVKQYVNSVIPYVHLPTVFARAEQCSMVDLVNKYDSFEGLKDEELFVLWKQLGLIKEDKPTREEYKANFAVLQRQLEVKNFLKSLVSFYRELDRAKV